MSGRDWFRSAGLASPAAGGLMSRQQRQELGDAGRQTVMATRSSQLYARAYRALFIAVRSCDEPDLATALETT